ncbi:MAG: DUF3575 domain-containing protein [Dysgonamonadaceae bacterium]|jgi:hypothetical protein|nr:DUF3575 domain-containing protein [Dysgonamonadaceae bacterium]
MQEYFLLQKLNREEIYNEKRKFFCVWIAFLFSTITVCAQNNTTKANLSFIVGNKKIEMASNGDIISMTDHRGGSYFGSNDITVSDYSGVSIAENRENSVWKGDYYPSVYYFPIGKYTLLREYRNNNIMLSALDELVRDRQTVQNMDTVEIMGACSPSGGEEYNLKLALSRCMALRSYLRWKHLSFAEQVPIKFTVVGVDWAGYHILKESKTSLSEKGIWDMLQYSAIRLKMKDGSYIIPGSDKPKTFFKAASAPERRKTETLSSSGIQTPSAPPAGNAIRNSGDGNNIQQGNNNNIHSGNHINISGNTINIYVGKQSPVLSGIMSDTLHFNRGNTHFVYDTLAPPPPSPAPPAQIIYPMDEKVKAPAFFALKTNLLYDALLLPNLTAEWYIGRQWSLAVEGNWSWWTFDRPIQNWWYHRIQAAGVEVRKWINSSYPLQGHALGAYAMTGNYDVRLFTENEYTQGQLSYQSWSAGLSYAYSFPVARKFNLELGLAFGYVGGRYYRYDYCMTHEHWAPHATFNRSYWGPTRVGISLVWLLSGHNEKK